MCIFDILSDILSGWHLFWHTFWHIFWHCSWHSFYLASSLFWHSIWHSFWHILWHSIWHSFWHLFWHSLWRLAEVRPCPRLQEEKEEEKEETTLIKSRDHHLAGGEKDQQNHGLRNHISFSIRISVAYLSLFGLRRSFWSQNGAWRIDSQPLGSSFHGGTCTPFALADDAVHQSKVPALTQQGLLRNITFSYMFYLFLLKENMSKFRDFGGDKECSWYFSLV